MRRNSNLPWLIPCFAGLLLGALSGPSGAQVTGAAAPGALFEHEERLSLRLEASFAAVKRGGTADPEFQPARLIYTDAGGATVAADLRVRARGKSRRAVCSFPPLLLNFRAKELGGTVFDGQNRLKLVTHCEQRATNTQYVHLEYLAYRVLHLVTDAGLRARPVDVTYFDTDRGREVAAGPGILLEDEELFAARLGLHAIADERLSRASYDPAALTLIEMFQFFIGNTDWSAFAGPAGSACCHNIVPLARDDGVLLPIAYDFDSSGIVDPTYALPDERLRIRSVRDRVYRGSCPNSAALSASLAPFEARRDEIRALYEHYPLLTKQGREKALAYVDEFYTLIADPQRVERAFRSGCSG